MVWELVFDDSWFYFRTYPYFETFTADFSSSCVFGTYRGFETINGIHINVDFQVFTHLWNKTRFFDKVKYVNKIENKNKLFYYDLKIITALRNQNIYNICSYNIDLTRNAGNCLLKMLENKSPKLKIISGRLNYPLNYF